MTTRTLSNACDRYAAIADRLALGDSVSEEENRWHREHATVCAGCKAEAAFYAKLPSLISTAGVTVPPRRVRPSFIGRKRLRTWALIAATLTIGGVAAAELFVGRAPRATAPAIESPVLQTATKPMASVALPVDDAEPIESSSKPEPTQVGGKPKRGTPVAAPASPDDLLQEARSARAAGDQTAAASTYKRLLREFPRSPQAHAARLSLGDLQLGPLGDPAGALASFDAYLQAGGALTPEARYGRIRALGALGRTADEKREAAKFVKDYPGTPQANSLAARLSAP